MKPGQLHCASQRPIGVQLYDPPTPMIVRRHTPVGERMDPAQRLELSGPISRTTHRLHRLRSRLEAQDPLSASLRDQEVAIGRHGSGNHSVKGTTSVVRGYNEVGHRIHDLGRRKRIVLQLPDPHPRAIPSRDYRRRARLPARGGKEAGGD